MSDSRPIRVPASRLARMARLGGMASGIAGTVALEGARRVSRGERPPLRDLVLTPGNAERLARELARMRGAAMKVGQLISMDAGDMILPDLQAILDASRTSTYYRTGLSPRAALGLLHAAKAWALLAGRDHVLPEDLQAVLPNVVAHRLRPADDDIGRREIQSLIQPLTEIPIP